MGTKSGELRELLMDTIEKVRAGEIEPNQAKAVAMLAGQINLSLQVEVNARINQLKWGDDDHATAIGHMPLGEENAPIDVTPRLMSEQQPDDAIPGEPDE